MKRKQFLKKAFPALASLTALSQCRKIQHSQGTSRMNPRIQWRLVSSFPRGIDTIYSAAEILAHKVRVLSGGNFTIRAYPAGEMIPPLQVMDSVKKGTFPIGHTASYYYTGKNPALAFDCVVPFGLTARQQNAWVYYGGGKELLQELFADFSIMPLPGGNTGTQMGGWFRKPIQSIEELRGLKMRIPGQGGKVMNALGVNVQVLAGGDIYPALERGTIDATEWVGPYDDEKLGFYKVAKHYYYPGWWEPGAQLSFYINLQEWKRLPIHYREILDIAAKEANILMLAQYDYKNPLALSSLLDKGVQLHAFSQDIMQAAWQASEQIMEETALSDKSYAKIYNSWKKFRKQSFQWFASSDLAYANFAFPRPNAVVEPKE
ncbi:MAG: TRAP transporter substrate-binding protein [Spirochaetota bacterium]